MKGVKRPLPWFVEAALLAALVAASPFLLILIGVNVLIETVRQKDSRMMYEFMSDDGELIQAPGSMKHPPEVGRVYDVTRADGSTVKATRIYSRSAAVRVDNWKPYVSDRLPKNLKDCPCTPGGKPIITTRAQERDIMSRFEYARE